MREVVASVYDHGVRRAHACGGGSVYQRSRAVCLCPTLTPSSFLSQSGGGLVIRLEVTCCYTDSLWAVFTHHKPCVLCSGWVGWITGRQQGRWATAAPRPWSGVVLEFYKLHNRVNKWGTKLALGSGAVVEWLCCSLFVRLRSYVACHHLRSHISTSMI